MDHDARGVVDAAYLHTAASQVIDGNQAAVDVLSLRAGQTVVDVGCGSGDGLALLCAAVGPGVVVGVDHDAALLEEAHRRVPALRDRFGTEVRLLIGDARALPLDAGSVDAVTSRFVLQHLERPAAAVAEMVRVVRPGGVVSVLDADWSTLSIEANVPGREDIASTVDDDVPAIDDLERALMTLNARRLLRCGAAGRRIPGLLRGAGLCEVQRRGFAEVDDDLALVRACACLEEIEREAIERGLLSAADINRWRQALSESAATGGFLALSMAVLGWGRRI